MLDFAFDERKPDQRSDVCINPERFVSPLAFQTVPFSIMPPLTGILLLGSAARRNPFGATLALNSPKFTSC